MLSLKSFDIKFRGSSNQRIIDVKKSLLENKVVELDLDKKDSNHNFGRGEHKLYI